MRKGPSVFSHLKESVLEIERPRFWLPFWIGTWLAPGPIPRPLPWRLSASIFMWIHLEANPGLGLLWSKPPNHQLGFWNRHNVILHPSLCCRTGFDATRGPWMGFCWDFFCISAATGKCCLPRNPSGSSLARLLFELIFHFFLDIGHGLGIVFG